MKSGSLFSGILGFDLGLEASGIENVWRAEIDKFSNRVSEYRRPGVKNYGDVSTIDGRKLEPIDVISFGSPCQDLSVAGQRAGLKEGTRSGLFFEAARIINECRPAFAIWENVPGAYSSDAGRDFAMVLYIFRELGANDVAWRVFDSQYAGVPQQRRRIYLVADFRGRRAGEILFDASRCGGHPSPFEEAREGVASTLTKGSNRPGVNPPGRRQEDDYNLVAKPLGAPTSGGARLDMDNSTYVVETAKTVTAKWAKGSGGSAGDEVSNLAPMVAHSLAAEGFDASEDGTGRGTPLTVIGDVTHATKDQNGSGIREDGIAYTLERVNQQAVAMPVAFQPRYARNGRGAPSEVAAPLMARAGEDGRGDAAQLVIAASVDVYNGSEASLAQTLHSEDQGIPRLRLGSTIRRFTPVECERLQGFPDGWTCLCGAEGDIWSCKCSDGPRYRAIGNANTVNVTTWIARRLAEIAG